VKTPQEIQAEVLRITGRGVQSAGYFLSARVKELISVPAPRRIVIAGPNSKTPGLRYYVATTKAKPGAPPRKLSGRGRANVAAEYDEMTNTSRVGVNLKYMGAHERGTHAFLLPSLVQWGAEIGRIVGAGV
jgi:hypothetical protein